MSQNNYITFLKDLYGDVIPDDLKLDGTGISIILSELRYSGRVNSPSYMATTARYGIGPFSAPMSWEQVGAYVDRCASKAKDTVERAMNRLRKEGAKVHILVSIGLYKGCAPEGAPTHDGVPVMYSRNYADLIRKVCGDFGLEFLEVDARLKAVVDYHVSMLPERYREPLILRYGLGCEQHSRDALTELTGLSYSQLNGVLSKALWILGHREHRAAFRYEIQHNTGGQL